MTMITPSYLGETIEYSSLHACRSTLEDPTLLIHRRAHQYMHHFASLLPVSIGIERDSIQTPSHQAGLMHRTSLTRVKNPCHEDALSPFAVALLWLAALTPLFLAGCCNCARQSAAVADRLNPPNLLPMDRVAASINANNQKIPTLWSRLNYSVSIIDNGKTHSVSSDDGVLLYSRPASFRLVGKKEIVGTVFDIGSNDQLYWLEVVPGTHRMWWGTYADLARLRPGQLPIPIRPDLVMEVLGVGMINTDFNALPVPTMRYDSAADAYVFVFNVKAPDRWLAQKEVWYDRRSLRPRRVVLYDADGRPVLTARLGMDKKMQIPDKKPEDWPLVPGDYKVFFPDSGSKMEFSLTDVRLFQAIGPGGSVHIPNPSSFGLPDAQATGVRTIQIGGGGVQ